jgi:hypothetical protein
MNPQGIKTDQVMFLLTNKERAGLLRVVARSTQKGSEEPRGSVGEVVGSGSKITDVSRVADRAFLQFDARGMIWTREGSK